MPFLKIWIHLVWSTKNRQPVLTEDIRQILLTHIKENAKEKNIHVDFLNGYIDHVHMLISLNADQTIAKIVQLLKGESSYWVNKNKLCAGKFEWQGDYFAASVSESGVNRVREYIKDQESHHTTKTFSEEYTSLFDEYGFELLKG